MEQTVFAYGLLAMPFVAVVLCTATGLLYLAGVYHNQGHRWADSVCNVSGNLCAYPDWLALLSIIVVTAAVIGPSLKS